MTWVLFIILVNGAGPTSLTKLAEYDTMEVCFEERQKVVKQLGRPIVNYQVICVRKQ